MDVTTLRTHPIYSAYNNWSRLLILGICPFLLLVFFNTKIYNDIVERRRRRLRLVQPPTCTACLLQRTLTNTYTCAHNDALHSAKRSTNSESKQWAWEEVAGNLWPLESWCSVVSHTTQGIGEVINYPLRWGVNDKAPSAVRYPAGPSLYFCPASVVPSLPFFPYFFLGLRGVRY